MLKTLICLFLLIALSVKSQETIQPAETEEFSYDELLNKIQSKQKKIIKSTASSPWDQVYIYPGFSFIHSYTKIGMERSTPFFHSGLQISLGMDLFSDYWFSECAFRNFGISKDLSTELFLTELDFKIGHKNYLSEFLEYRLSLGVSTRTIRVSNSETGLFREDKNPALITGIGLFTSLKSTPVLLGIEANLRSLLVSSDFDGGSAGLNLLFMGYF